MVEKLVGGRFSEAVRDGDSVLRRRGGPNSAALLDHLADRGFALSPRHLGSVDDRDVLTYIPGTSGWPPFTSEIRSVEALVSVSRAIRAMHDATVGFVPPEPDTWHRMDVAAPTRIDCVGHHDLSPWNFVFDGTTVVGIVDWDTIGPSNRTWDLSFAAYQFVPLYPPAALPVFGWPAEPDRRERFRVFAEAYGPEMKPAALLDLAVVRLASLTAHMDEQVRAGNPAYEVMGREHHADGLRASVAYLCEHRGELLGPDGAP